MGVCHMMHRYAAVGFAVFLTVSCGGGGSSSGGSGGTTVNPGTTTTIATDNATLTIPANTFGDSLTVSLSESASLPSEITTSTPISPIVTMAFSTAHAAQVDASFSLAVTLSAETIAAAEAADEAIYALIRESDDVLAHIDIDEDTAIDPFNWRIAFGTLDESTGAYTLPFTTTATSMEVLITRGDDLYLYTEAADSNSNDVPPSQSLIDNLSWTSRPWMVICHEQTMTGANERACNPNAGDSFIMDDILSSVTNAAELLSVLGWVSARTHVMSKAEILDLRLRPHPNLDTAANDTTYNVIFLKNVVPNASRDSRGGYFFDSGDLYVVPRSVNAERQQFSGNIFVHELFHAVQGATFPAPYLAGTENADYRWFLEATAHVMAMFALDGDESALRDKKTNGARRSWEISLRNYNDFLTPYRTFEFFAFLNEGDVDYLPDLYSLLAGSAGGTNSYVEVHNAFESLFTGQGLADVYTQRVMSQRGVGTDENDCTYIDITEELDNDGVFTMTPGDGYSLNINLTPLSSLCFDVFADREDDSLLKITVTSEDEDQQLLVLGSEDEALHVAGADTEFTFAGERGLVANAGTGIKTIGDDADIRIIRDAYTNPESDAQPWSIEFKNDFTGTWCSSYEFGAARTPCEDYGSLLHLEEDESGNLAGSGMIFVCEVTYSLLSTDGQSTASGNTLSIALDTSSSPIDTDCNGFSATFSLTYVNDRLEGTWSLPARGPLTPAQTETVILERVSVDPDYIVPFELNSL